MKSTALMTAAALGLMASGALAGEVRTDTSIQANATEPAPGGKYSNWPALPERQAGRSYSAIIKTTSGVRERNAESGRR